MKKYVFILLVCFSLPMKFSHAMEAPQDEVQSQLLSLDGNHYQLLVYQTALLTILLKQAQEEQHCEQDACLQCGTRKFEPFVEFLLSSPSFETNSLVASLIKQEDFDGQLELYCDSTEGKALLFSGNTINQEQFRVDVKEKLTEEQKNFFNDFFNDRLPTSSDLWIKSRIKLLQELQILNQRTTSLEYLTQFLDKGFSYSSGACAGYGLSSLILGQPWIPAVGLMIFSAMACVSLRDVNCSFYFKNKKGTVDNKIVHAITRLEFSKSAAITMSRD